MGSPMGPVLLVHGLGANRYNMDAPVHEINFAEYLRARELRSRARLPLRRHLPRQVRRLKLLFSSFFVFCARTN